ncbi:7TM chemoreceptor [Cinara cedri]|uniref:Gustatory receptor n=1 Tax=Cinara cedri TaxID=506608 RepID=A0A5E4MEY4_9HEMI|nr:7TM chemoreceptor [Cinara cedri]
MSAGNMEEYGRFPYVCFYMYVRKAVTPNLGWMTEEKGINETPEPHKIHKWINPEISSAQYHLLRMYSCEAGCLNATQSGLPIFSFIVQHVVRINYCRINLGRLSINQSNRSVVQQNRQLWGLLMLWTHQRPTEYDRKLTVLPKVWMEQHQRCISKRYWNAFLVVLFAYYVSFQIYYTYLWPPKTIDFSILTIILFQPPFIIDFAVIVISCFYIVNLERRFDMLNSVWQRLSTGLVAVPGSYTYSEIAVLVENIRLLHAELCELLRIFSSGFGQVLLAYFVISYVNMVFQFFLMISLKFATPRFNITENIIRSLLPYVMNLQHIVFVMFIIVAASRIIEKVKQFMNQILIYESDEMTAFGFFNIDLNLAVTILVLLITGLSTLIQMKEHPIILYLVNDTLSYVVNLIENTYGEDWAQGSQNTNETI